VNIALLGGSLAAIVALYYVARWLGLGGDVRIADRLQAEALVQAEGFEPDDLIVDRGGIAAIARDSAGRHMLIRRHGVNFVARLLSTPLDARLDKNFLTIGTGDRAFGRITLDLGDAAGHWAASLRRVA